VLIELECCTRPNAPLGTEPNPSTGR